MFNSVKNSFDYIPCALVMIIFLSELHIQSTERHAEAVGQY